MVKIYKVIELDLYNKLMDIFRREHNTVTLEELPLPPPTQLSETGENLEKTIPVTIKSAETNDYWTSFEKAVNELKRKGKKRGKRRNTRK